MVGGRSTLRYTSAATPSRSVPSFLFADSARAARWAFQTLRSGPSDLESEAGDSDQFHLPGAARPPAVPYMCPMT